jgi:beta-lactamase regulating signal transducer with metallopeptidase domain
MSALLPAILLRLGAATVVFTLLAGLLMLARRPLRARFGAAAVYALWLAVPIGLALCCWPRHALPAPAAGFALPLAAADAIATGTAAPVAAPDLTRIVLGAWLAGAAASAAMLLVRQRACWRAIGPLRPGPAGAWLSLRPDMGPLLAGLARPRIVLPADFAQRYDPAEQAAVLAHERVHARRGDLWWNALAALLGCLFWFHPLAGAARRRYLADQELACDGAVLRTGLHAPRTYGNALLKTITTASLPVGCTMQAISPIKERIMHLQHPHHSTGSRRVRLAVAAALAGFTLAGAGLGWAATGEAAASAGATTATATAAAAGGYRLAMDVSVDGGAVRHEEAVTSGAYHLAGLRNSEGQDCEADLTLRDAANASVMVQVMLVCEGKPAAAPRLMGKLGEPMTIAIGRSEQQADGSHVIAKGFRLSMKIDKA